MKDTKLIKQAAGTLKKVEKMMEEDVYCVEIIQQLDSVTGLLATARRKLLSDHLAHCVHQKFKDNPKAAVAELEKLYQISK